METLLRINNLSIGFNIENNYFEAVDRISFNINKGECVALVGESGCGKSISAMSIIKLLPTPPAIIKNGEIIFENRDIFKLKNEELRAIRGKEIGVIFQEPMSSLNPTKTIGEQIAEVFKIHYPQLTKKDIKDRVISLLKKVGIPLAEERINSYPHEFSGGMRQRVMIAIAIACNPKLLIADEPTTALDVTIQAQILELIKNIQKEYGMSILLITHNMGIVVDMCKRVLIMYAGRIIESGDVIDIFSEPLHPYTKGLLDSIPLLNREKDRLYSIPGIVPHPSDFIKGCRFRDRCTKRFEKCNSDDPPLLLNFKNNHSVACWLYEKG
ncbi:MAG TPA: ABC transporter ATP-binding protein [Spirochaetota bacterium]|nr:ABC transporter ATP-binding protein [Spirochaetota bacterium]HOL57806.1 ABC transporter ATP-binding protein [Spirochaetota bacterium]HPP05421.1 ABC transporter ATP-binding protein [Spirochaetota bacterium]